MAKKKEKTKSLSKIKEEKIIIGSRRVLKLIKQGKIKNVVLARDLDENIKKEIKEISKILKVNVEEVNKSKQEIAEELKKPFAIGCIGW